MIILENVVKHEGIAAWPFFASSRNAGAPVALGGNNNDDNNDDDDDNDDDDNNGDNNGVTVTSGKITWIFQNTYMGHSQNVCVIGVTLKKV